MGARQVYMDHNATTPLHPEVARTLHEAMEVCGNPSSMHGFGRLARRDGELSLAQAHIARAVQLSPDDASAKRELLLLAPSILVPCLQHDGIKVWDTLAIAEYLHEVFPQAGLLPRDLAARTHCRSVSGEIHSGFANLRSALPMNLKVRHDRFPVFPGARPDIERVETIWSECLDSYGGPWLFGASPTVADAMFAPVVTRFITYQLPVARFAEGYMRAIIAHTWMQEWIGGAQAEDWVIDRFESPPQTV